MKKTTLLIILFFGLTIFGFGQAKKKVAHLPIFDIHVHAMKVNPEWGAPMCPWFLSNMPGTDPNLPMVDITKADCVDPLIPAKNDKEMPDEVIKRIHDFIEHAIAFSIV